MTSYQDQVQYQTHSGTRKAGHLRVFALSTCAFCERSLTWLKEQDISHEFVFVDTLDPEFKRNLKTELKERYGPIQVFPVLIIDHEKMVSGFTVEKWGEALGIG